MSLNPMRYNLHIRAREPFVLKNIRSECLKAGQSFQKNLVLDLGCGLGVFTQTMNKFGLKVIGVDIDWSTLYEAARLRFKERISPVDSFFVCANATLSPFKDRSFNAVLATELIEHLPDNDVFLGEIGRLLRENGILILTTVCLDGILPVSDFLHTEGSEKHYKIGYTTKELRNLLERYGFVIEHIRYAFSGISRILMEGIKAVYKIKAGSYQYQKDIFSVSDSLTFKIYKRLFPVLMIINAFDRFLARFIKGDIIMIRARKA